MLNSDPQVRSIRFTQRSKRSSLVFHSDNGENLPSASILLGLLGPIYSYLALLNSNSNMKFEHLRGNFDIHLSFDLLFRSVVGHLKGRESSFMRTSHKKRERQAETAGVVEQL